MRIKNELKKTIKNFQALVAEKKSDEAKKVLLKVSSPLDKAANKNFIHANTASRRKSRLTRKILKAA